MLVTHRALTQAHASKHQKLLSRQEDLFLQLVIPDPLSVGLIDLSLHFLVPLHLTKSQVDGVFLDRPFHWGYLNHWCAPAKEILRCRHTTAKEIHKEAIIERRQNDLCSGPTCLQFSEQQHRAG